MKILKKMTFCNLFQVQKYDCEIFNQDLCFSVNLLLGLCDLVTFLRTKMFLNSEM